MAININDSILNRSPKDLNEKTGVFQGGVWRPYNNIAEALANPKLVQAYRHRGLTIFILEGGQLTEYWWRDGTANNQLIKKSTEGKYFNISFTDFTNSTTYNNTQLVGSNYTVEYIGNTSGGGSFDRGKLIEGTEYIKLGSGGFILQSPYSVRAGDIFIISNAFNSLVDNSDKANLSGAVFTGDISAPNIYNKTEVNEIILDSATSSLPTPSDETFIIV